MLLGFGISKEIFRKTTIREFHSQTQKFQSNDHPENILCLFLHLHADLPEYLEEN